MRDLSTLLQLAQKTVKNAVSIMGADESEYKRVKKNLTRDVKVVADQSLENFIVDELSAATPYPILAEENGKLMGDEHHEGFHWIIDPLDGSLNFSRNIPLSCISLALWQKASPILGVIYDFNHNENYTGIIGKGAWLNGKPITPSRVNQKKEAVICTGFPVSTDFTAVGIQSFVLALQEYKKVRLFGSAALSIAYVACGRADAYWENNIKIWDVAAGIAIIQAAGGKANWSSTIDDQILNVKAGNSFLEL